MDAAVTKVRNKLAFVLWTFKCLIPIFLARLLCTGKVVTLVMGPSMDSIHRTRCWQTGKRVRGCYEKGRLTYEGLSAWTIFKRPTYSSFKDDDCGMTLSVRSGSSGVLTNSPPPISFRGSKNPGFEQRPEITCVCGESGETVAQVILAAPHVDASIQWHPSHAPTTPCEIERLMGKHSSSHYL